MLQQLAPPGSSGLPTPHSTPASRWAGWHGSWGLQFQQQDPSATALHDTQDQQASLQLRLEHDRVSLGLQAHLGRSQSAGSSAQQWHAFSLHSDWRWGERASARFSWQQRNSSGATRPSQRWELQAALAL